MCEIGTSVNAWAKARSRTTGYVLSSRLARFYPDPTARVLDEVMEEFAVTREQVNAVLHFAALSLKLTPSASARTPAPADAHSL